MFTRDMIGQQWSFKTDEILQYIDARCVSAPESCWRILGFKLHDHSPNIQRLQVHLPDQQQVTFNAEGNLADEVNHETARKTTLTQYFEINRENELARDTTYLDFLRHFVYYNTRKIWTMRSLGVRVGRLYLLLLKLGIDTSCKLC